MDRQRLRRVFAVLSYLSAGPASLSQISKDLGVPLSSAHDLLHSLLELDAISLQGRAYSLGPRSIGLSIEMQNSMSVLHLSQRVLEQLARDTQLDVYLAVRAGTGVVHVARYTGSRVVNIDIPLGRRVHLHATAVGKLFAAFDRDMYDRLVVEEKPQLTSRTRTSVQQLEPDLRSIRARKVSISYGESVEGVIDVAVPVHDPHGGLVAALHLSVLEAAAPPGELQEAIALLRRAAQDVETGLVRRLAAPR